LPELTWPGLRLVKPLWEAESRGVSEASVVNTKQEMAEAVRAIWHQFNQEALVEEYLPGPEYTVTLAGNGSDALAMGLITHFNPDYYEKYPLITPNLKDGGLSYQRLVGKEEVEICSLAKHAAEAVGACDHVRVDIRRDAQGIAKVLEVNGIPGLQPGRSRSLALHAMYFPELDEATNHRQLVNRIVDAALKRNDLE
ncbi:MAG TPA: D-alanine--D-alanine ligase, partial [Cytophagales bacterium]|nr:D-alanine--D-alanine ligase [Cytophagales bacterium]